jgi:hypothetical protein
MPYRSPLQAIIHPDNAGRPSVMHYRIAFTRQEPWLAIIELRHADPEFASPVKSAAARDQVLNRLLESELRGLPLNALRLVASDQAGEFECELVPDIHDYVQRGNRYKVSPERARRGRHVERVEIDPDKLVAGRVRVDTVHDAGSPVSDVVRAALA